MNQPVKKDPTLLLKLSIIIGLIVLLFICGLLLWHFYGHKSHTIYQSTSYSPNLLILSDPDKCIIIVDGKEAGITEKNMLDLYIEPDRMHKLQATKEGYESFESVIWGKAEGFYKEKIRLVKKIDNSKTQQIPTPLGEGEKGGKGVINSRDQTPSPQQGSRDVNSKKSNAGFIERMDLNNDKKISQQEYLDDFLNRDKNGDGMISLDECPSNNSEKFMNRHDNNRDQKITEDEILVDFSDRDRNKDNFISNEELPPGG